MKLSELKVTHAQEERVERPARMKPKAMEDLIDREVPEGSADPARDVEGHQVANSGSTLTWRADRGVFEAPTITAFLRLPLAEKRPIIHGLLHHRDLVTLAGRRRHGKTTFLTQMAIATADATAQTFLGYQIAGPSRGLLVMTEDDAGELQEKIARQVGDRDLGERLRVVTRDNFRALGVAVDIRNRGFQDFVSSQVRQHQPAWVGVDNISQVVRGNYNSPTVIDELMSFGYDLTAKYDCAVVFAAHPRKRNRKARLADDSDAFFEEVMGSSHGINSTGSLWGLEREGDTTVFVGGRQRADGRSQAIHLRCVDDGNFAVVPNDTINLQVLLSTDARRTAWDVLPDAFTYDEAEQLIVPAEMRSKSTFHDFFSHGQRLGLILDGTDGQWQKLKLTDTTEPGEVTEVTEVAQEFQQP